MSNENLQVNTNRGLNNWAINALRFYYQRTLGNLITRRNPKLWIFSSWEGTKYADNAKYLFEYVNENNDKGIICVWITKSMDAFNEVVELGYKACLIGTKECKTIEKKAGVALSTHGLDDFGDFPYCFGSVTVNLCHSAGGNKKSYYGMKKNNLRRILSVAKAKIFNYVYRDITISTSKFSTAAINEDLLSSGKPTPIIGLARNDFINEKITNLQEVFSDKCIEKYGLSLGGKYIVYMPTYRPYRKSQRQLESIISEIVGDKNLQALLKDNNTKFVVKLHYCTDASRMHFSDDVILLKDSDVLDVAKLLRLSSLLITDYSSCAMDFSLKQNDVVFFAPDLEDYEKETGMHQEFLDYLYKYRLCTINQLTERIENDMKTNFAVTESTNELNKLFNERYTEVGNFRKLTYEYVCSKLGI